MFLTALLAVLLLCVPALGDEPKPEPAGPAWAEIEDPRRLEDLGDEAREAGDKELATALYKAALKRMEVKKYLNYRPMLGEALLLERMGEFEASGEKYREGMRNDVHRTIAVLRIVSEHPEREKLVKEAYDLVREIVEIAKSGGKGQIYTTSKGEPRYLQVMTTEEVLKKKRVRYCYIEDFDLTAIDEIPDALILDRCVVGRILAADKKFGKLAFMGIVLGDADFGKTWEGDRNKSKTTPASTFASLTMREAIFMGRANFWGISVTEGRGYFPMVIFEHEADFKGAEFWGDTDFRFASFGKDANFKKMRLHAPVFFGGSVYRDDTVFTSMYSERDVYFNSTRFERSVSVDKCEFQKGATFEDARFKGEVNFGTTTVVGGLNFSRAVFHEKVNVVDVEVGELDALGAHFYADALFKDAEIDGRSRFSLDDVTRVAHLVNVDGLLPAYRHYQGDEDADEPLTEKSSYGVVTVDDLTSKIDGNISFANTVFNGFTVFEGVTFGQAGLESMASFYNTQFLGETHFERTHWHSQADFTTIFGNEVAFNRATFYRSLILDDANIRGRVSLTDAVLVGDADISFYASEIASFEINPPHVNQPKTGYHRFFYERCADGDIDYDDVRIQRIVRGQEDMEQVDLEQACFDYLIDEFVALKETYGDRAMISEEDDAYWWTRYYQTRMRLNAPEGFFDTAYGWIIEIGLFELCFGWGVRLGNLGVAVIVITFLFAVIYRVSCPETILVYDGEDIKVKDVEFSGLLFISLQSMLAINTGWDFGDDDHRFRWLNSLQTLIGVIILTFFVGAYTRMILA